MPFAVHASISSINDLKNTGMVAQQQIEAVKANVALALKREEDCGKIKVFLLLNLPV